MDSRFIEALKGKMWDRQYDVVAGIEESEDGKKINETVVRLQKKIAGCATDAKLTWEMIRKIELLVGEEKFLLQDSCYTQGFIDGITTIAGLKVSI